MSVYSEYEVYPSWADVDQTECENCNFPCGTVGYCIDECGENYIISKLITSKGYTQCNIDYVFQNGKSIPGVEIYKRECKKFMNNLHELGHECIMIQHPLGKRYLATVIVDGGINPIKLCTEFLKLEVIK